MANILCIETSAAVCSVALAVNGETVAVRESDSGRNHAGNIGVFADEILRANNMGPEDLDAVAVSSGPGSYTGLRIGVSFAKGLCYGLQIPLVAVGSLDSLVQVAREDYEAGIIDVEQWDDAVLCPMVDARRMEVYTQMFDAKGQSLNEVKAEIIAEDSFAEWRNGRPFVIFGNGAAKCQEVLTDAILVNVTPSARGLAALAHQRFEAGQTEDIAYFEPFYLKDFIVIPSKKKLL